MQMFNTYHYQNEILTVLFERVIVVLGLFEDSLS